MRARVLRVLFKVPLTNDSRSRLIKRYKDRLLRQTMRHAYENSPFYRRKFDELEIRPNDVRKKEDLAELPLFTTPQDIMEDPFQFLAVPREKIQYMWTTSGTTGKPKVALFTKEDISSMVEAASRGLTLLGVGEGDVAQIVYAYGQPSWSAGPFVQSALETTGCFIIPSGNQRSIEEQIETMVTYGTTLLYGTPSYIHRLTEERGKIVDLRSLKVRAITLGAEPWPESFREYLEDAWGAKVYDSYGMTEMGNLVAGECSAHNGLHITLGIAVEVVDLQTGEAVERGEEGELVFTTLNREGMPFIRYRSGDISRLMPDESCACGIIPTSKMARVKGRVDDMTFLGTGENVYPRQFDEVLLPIEHVLGYQLIIGKEGYRDTLLLKVETDSPSEGLEREIVDRLYRGISFLRHDVTYSQTIAEPVVEFIEPGELAKDNPIKAKRFIDRRPWD